MRLLVSLWLCAAAVAAHLLLREAGALVAEATDATAALRRERLLERQLMEWGAAEVHEGRFEGDILLTAEQQLTMTQRKVITSESSWWPADAGGTVTVNYRIVNDGIDVGNVQEAVQAWRDNTCIEFRQLSYADGKPHLVFRSSDSGCYSYIGRIQANGQPVNLGRGCQTSIGTPIHEIGHAMGFFHEQSRSGRDEYVLVALDNVQSGAENNFKAQTTNNFRVPYDYFSIMHYGSDYFTKNSKDTLVATVPYGQALMGQRQYFSFMDKKIANLQYNCVEKYLAACGESEDPCQNDGYYGKDCACVCPEGTSGALCETREAPYLDALAAKATPNSETYTTEGTVTTPGYPASFSGEEQYVQVVRAPACQRVRLTFDTFSLRPALSDGTCYFNKLTLRLSDDLLQSDSYCGSDIKPGTVFESENSTILLHFVSRSTVPTPGYSADFVFIDKDIPECTTTAPQTTTPSTTAPVTTPPNTTPPTVPPTVPPTTPPTAPPTTPPTVQPTLPPTTPPVTTPPTTTPPVPPPAATTTTAPIITINSGLITALGTVLSGGCTVVTRGSTIYILSPRFPGLHPSGSECSVALSTAEPRYLSVVPVTLGVTARDDMRLEGVYHDTQKITRSSTGSNIVLPAAQANFSYMSKRFTRSLPFFLVVTTLNNECHQIIELPAGAEGELQLPESFSSSPICEWWLRAPPGSQVQISVQEYEAGSSDCDRSYALVDISGEDYHALPTTRLCGGETPTLVSTASAINVLLNGLHASGPSFRASYSVV